MFKLIKKQYKIVTSDLRKGVFSNYTNYSYYIYTVGHGVFVVEIIQDTGSIRGPDLTAILLGVLLGLAGQTDKSIHFYLPLRR